MKESSPPCADGDVAELLRVTGELARLRILPLCFDAPAPSVSWLRTGIAASLASHHLRLLQTTGHLSAERRGKHVIHLLRGARVGCIVIDLAAHVMVARRRVEAPE